MPHVECLACDAHDVCGVDSTSLHLKRNHLQRVKGPTALGWAGRGGRDGRGGGGRGGRAGRAGRAGGEGRDGRGGAGRAGGAEGWAGGWAGGSDCVVHDGVRAGFSLQDAVKQALMCASSRPEEEGAGDVVHGDGEGAALGAPLRESRGREDGAGVQVRKVRSRLAWGGGVVTRAEHVLEQRQG